MAKDRVQYYCVTPDCDAKYAKWVGVCAKCKQVGSVVENDKIVNTNSTGLKGNLTSVRPAKSARRVKDIETTSHRHSPTGIKEFDRTLGGGVVSGQTILLAGEPGVGKALALDTLLRTPMGWITMGEVKVGDSLVDSQGETTRVIATTEVFNDRPCYLLKFIDGTEVVADENHQWYVGKEVEDSLLVSIATTLELYRSYTRDFASLRITSPGELNDLSAILVSIEPTDSVSVRCVEVDSPDHTYLITKSLIPTHNSTILLLIADSIAKSGKTVLYVSGEESAEQITLRARRTNTLADDLYIADETDLSVLIGHLEEVDPDFLIVDSVQTLASPDVDGRAGGISQVQEVASSLTRLAKSRHMPLILVGQVTKDGAIGGPKQLEHLVDTVIEFFGDKNTPLRIMRVVKNRMGPADEVSCWEQTELGIREVPDPSGLFRTGREEPIAGTCITVTMEGHRAILAEVQALVSTTNAPNPRRGVSGLDSARMAMLVAVTEKHARLRLYDKDSYLATVAGMKIVEPAADLAVCLALASAHMDAPLPLDVAAIGEVSLSGDIRSATNMTIRLNEASRLGFKRILVPKGTVQPPKTDMVLIKVANLGEAIRALRGLTPARPKEGDSEGSESPE